jgi:maleamate amidohydrolase
VDAYEKASYGELPVGFGEKPGIVVIDFQICYTDSKYPFGGAPLMMRALDNTAKLLEVARRANVPVANCYTAYMNKREMPYWKISVLYDLLRHDNPAAELDPRIFDPEYDLKICKKAPSIFFETGVANYFTKERVDTVIITGCNTSGCIRAAAIDSFSHRYHTIISRGLRRRPRRRSAQRQSARCRSPLRRHQRPAVVRRLYRGLVAAQCAIA